MGKGARGFIALHSEVWEGGGGGKPEVKDGVSARLLFLGPLPFPPSSSQGLDMFHPLIRLPSISARLSPRAFGGERMRLRLPSLDFGMSVHCVNAFFHYACVDLGVVEGM